MFTVSQVLSVLSIVVSLVLAYVGMKAKLDKVISQNQKLLSMHEHPEDTGFGTVGHRAAFEENTRAVRQLAHYLRWFIKSQTGEDPPPPME